MTGWLVTLKGHGERRHAVTLEAEMFEITDRGHLLLWSEGDRVAAVASDSWVSIEETDKE